MGNEEIIKNWIKLSEYDLKTAHSMLFARRYLYVVFTCQQALEKILKAVYVKEKQETPPYTHNLMRILEKLSLFKDFAEKEILFLEELNSYYIESRYTETISIITKSLNKKKATSLYTKTQRIYQWLKNKI